MFCDLLEQMGVILGAYWSCTKIYIIMQILQTCAERGVFKPMLSVSETWICSCLICAERKVVPR